MSRKVCPANVLFDYRREHGYVPSQDDVKITQKQKDGDDNEKIRSANSTLIVPSQSLLH